MHFLQKMHLHLFQFAMFVEIKWKNKNRNLLQLTLLAHVTTILLQETHS